MTSSLSHYQHYKNKGATGPTPTYRPAAGWSGGYPLGPIGWRFTWREWNRYKRHWDGCAFCGGKQETIAAMVAWRHGGARTIGNAVPACKSCVFEKHQRPLTRWRLQQRIEVDALTMTVAEFAVKYGLEKAHARHLRRLKEKHARARARAAASRLPRPRVYAEDGQLALAQNVTLDWDAEDPEWGVAIVRVNTQAQLRNAERERAAARRRNGL